MWFEFNNVIFNIKDLVYIEKVTIHRDGNTIIALEIKTSFGIVRKEYGVLKDTKAYTEREKDYNIFIAQLKVKSIK